MGYRFRCDSQEDDWSGDTSFRTLRLVSCIRGSVVRIHPGAMPHSITYLELAAVFVEKKITRLLPFTSK